MTTRNILIAAIALCAVGALVNTFLRRSDPVEPVKRTVPAVSLVDEAFMTQFVRDVRRGKAYLATDKPMYRPTETVHVRGVVLDALDGSPFPVASVQWIVEIKDARGSTVHSTGLEGGDVHNEDAVVEVSWIVPRGTRGGEYEVSLSSPSPGIPTAKRTFSIREWSNPKLLVTLEFEREGYSPGDIVSADVAVRRAAGGGAAAGAGVSASAVIGGAAVWTTDGDGLRVALDGTCRVMFLLPATVKPGVGQATLSVTITDGGVVENIARTIPITDPRVSRVCGGWHARCGCRGTGVCPGSLSKWRAGRRSRCGVCPCSRDT